MGPVIAVVSLAAAAVLPIFVNNNTAIRVIGIFGFAMIGLSVGIITGLGGQLTLGQFAFAGIGAVVSYEVSKRTGNFPLALLYAGLAAGLVSLLIGLPALRIRGLFLAVTTLGFALVTAAWLLQQSWVLGDGVDPGRPIVLGHPLDTGRTYYEFSLAILVILFLLARNVRRTGLGRLLVAVRDNEDNARAFTVPARRVKLQAFLLAGFVAGVGGAAYGHAYSRIGPGSFPTQASVDVVVMTVIGGVGLLAGPILGALFVIGVPTFLPLDSAGIAATKLGLLFIILYFPGGLAQILLPLRDRLVTRLAGPDPDAAAEPESPAVARGVLTRTPAVPSGRVVANTPRRGPLLEAIELSKRFGGVAAVDAASLVVGRGETVGLIGPNGAGKTTLFEMLGGFTRPDAGRVLFAGDDVTDSARKRAPRAA